MSLACGTLESLIRQHESTLRRFVSRRSGPQVLAKTTVDDLFQEMVAQAVAQANRVAFEDDAHFLAWMQQILRGLISRTLRKQGLRSPLVRFRDEGSQGPGVIADILPHDMRSPSSLVAVGENIRRLRSAVQGLPHDYRAAVVLYRIEGRTLDEVAHALNRSKGAVAKLISRGLAMLAEEMTHP